ncbi:MAG: TIGR00730 family Rossman fold protein [Candidatus Zixiibacteriota bacterium]|nr:MAG: TIGR00730 family Rossman fold protein [candidate division Zixibacteria bacterium]
MKQWNFRKECLYMPKHLDPKKMVERLKKSPAYRIAYHDNDFMDQDFCRPVRLQLELLKPEMLFEEQNILSTIVVFGGTRIIEPSKARTRAQRLERNLKKKPGDTSLKLKLRRARAVLNKSRYYDEARTFGRLVSQEGQMTGNHNWVIVTGGGPGIMEAANRGAYEIGAKSIGLNITLPMEQQPNPYISPELCLQFHYFAIRKMHFMLRAKALVAFPGGYGTMDELFEALTLVQTEKVKPLPIILFGEKYWRSLIDFDYLVDEGTIDENDLELFVYADSAKDAWDYIKYFYASRDSAEVKQANQLDLS